ncbi:MAG: GNAT family N-acetyltransferase [Anaerolineae bacterium]|jgi:ribosomal protein S18 acetylase RimI-like enzyme|nr:GNAT family N-acetyltransferase [Anaerolineae bacterium]
MIPTPIKITQTLTEDQKQQVAALFYEAFSMKFHGLLDLPREEAFCIAFLRESINYEIGHYAVQGPKVLGVVALATGKQSFDQMTYPVFRKYFPFFGAMWRWVGYALFQFLHQPPDEETVLVDSLFVSSATRGMGIGSMLLNHAVETTRAMGRNKLILGVVNTNPGAKRLYERFGFEVYKTEKTGWFTSRAGFTSSYIMRKVLD